MIAWTGGMIRKAVFGSRRRWHQKATFRGADKSAKAEGEKAHYVWYQKNNQTAPKL